METKVAYQDKLIFDLNEVVLSHTRTIDRLESRIARLESVLRETAGGDGPIGHEPPPHY